MSAGAVYTRAAERDDGSLYTEQASGGGAGPQLAVALGGTPADGLVVGGEIRVLAPSLHLRGQSGFRSEPLSDIDRGRRAAIEIDSGLVEYFPDPRGGFHLGLSAGIATKRWQDSFAKGIDQTGIATVPRVGYGWWIGDEWSFGAAIDLTLARLWNNGDSSTTYVMSSLSLGFTYH